ncbi:LysR family transcriptional regulator [Clostridium hydrogenum]|uniref:LysR family transcriptional regulator n=1 Tax=Clostridium hydrogenum TaxID=2855764 RepID=UPI001F1F5169|nr:LysR family transcriptional regulator [Clostridium hydrogenum]
MNLQQLYYFKRLSETKNFTIAAELESVTQPALSKAIAKLEDDLGVNLFERYGRNVELTNLGSSFLKHVIAALKEIETGTDELKNLAGLNNDIISIASTHCISTYFTPFMISGFLTLYPNTKFQFINESTEEILNDLKNKKIDIGFYDDIDSSTNYSNINTFPVKKEEYVLIVPKKHTFSNKTEISLKTLKDEHFIIACENNTNKKISCTDFINKANITSIKPSETNMLIGLVSAGAGITIVPNTPLINTNTLSKIKIKENIGYKTINIGYNKDSNLSEKTMKFIEYVKNSSTINN